MYTVYKAGLAVVSVFAIIIAAFPATSAQFAGKAIGVHPNATLSNGEGSVRMKVGADVAMGDRVRTNRNGQVELKFTDETKLVVGPNSSLVIESYLLRSEKRANNFTIRALGGSFRMISGKSQKTGLQDQDAHRDDRDPRDGIRYLGCAKWCDRRSSL